ncbi:MAG TPA: hypothetical protein VGU66_06865 [Candidatus Elarobacter sp.]|nr:hypothetical protein [Candidatus Elarobacter sp.]
MRLSFIAAATGAALLAGARVASAATVVPATVSGNAGNTLHLSAAHPVPTTVASQPGPIHLDGCFSDSRGSEGLTLVHHAVRIANTGDRAITGVRVKFLFYDVFGDVNATRTNIAEARIEPGQLVDRINLSELADSAPPAKVVCSIDAVRYADGTVVRT